MHHVASYRLKRDYSHGMMLAGLQRFIALAHGRSGSTGVAFRNLATALHWRDRSELAMMQILLRLQNVAWWRAS